MLYQTFLVVVAAADVVLVVASSHKFRAHERGGSSFPGLAKFGCLCNFAMGKVNLALSSNLTHQRHVTPKVFRARSPQTLYRDVDLITSLTLSAYRIADQ